MLQQLLRRLVFDVPLLAEYCKMPLRVSASCPFPASFLLPVPSLTPTALTLPLPCPCRPRPTLAAPALELIQLHEGHVQNGYSEEAEGPAQNNWIQFECEMCTCLSMESARQVPPHTAVHGAWGTV